MQLNPVLVKELRGRMRGPRAFLLLTIYLVVLSGVALLLYLAVSGNAGNDLNAGRRIGQTLFFTIAAVALIEVCFITPTLTAASIAGEKERQTYDLLIASLLSPWQIVWGKLISALAYALLLIVAVVPLMSLAFLFGGVSPAEVLIALIGLLATAVFYACIGLFWSTVMRSTLGASSMAIGTILFMLLGIPFMAIIVSLIFSTGDNAWMESRPVVYLGGAILVLHPFIALLLTETFIRDGHGVFVMFLDMPQTNESLLIPSPWLAYVGLAMLCSAVLITLSVRMIRPLATPDAPPGTPARASGEQPAEGSP